MVPRSLPLKPGTSANTRDRAADVLTAIDLRVVHDDAVRRNNFDVDVTATRDCAGVDLAIDNEGAIFLENIRHPQQRLRELRFKRQIARAHQVGAVQGATAERDH